MNETDIAWVNVFLWGAVFGIALCAVWDVVQAIRKRRRLKQMRDMKVQFDE